MLKKIISSSRGLTFESLTPEVTDLGQLFPVENCFSTISVGVEANVINSDKGRMILIHTVGRGISISESREDEILGPFQDELSINISLESGISMPYSTYPESSLNSAIYSQSIIDEGEVTATVNKQGPDVTGKFMQSKKIKVSCNVEDFSLLCPHKENTNKWIFQLRNVYKDNIASAYSVQKPFASVIEKSIDLAEVGLLALGLVPRGFKYKYISTLKNVPEVSKSTFPISVGAKYLVQEEDNFIFSMSVSQRLVLAYKEESLLSQIQSRSFFKGKNVSDISEVSNPLIRTIKIVHRFEINSETGLTKYYGNKKCIE